MMKNNILKKIIRIISLVLEPIVIIAISSIIVFALVLKVKAIKEGSNMNTKKYTIEEKKEKTLEYMKERYGEEFVGLRWSGKDFFQSYDKFVVYPKNKTPKDEVIVEWIYDEEKKDYDIYDSYMGILIKDKYTDYVTKLLKENYPNAYITSIEIDPEETYTSNFTMNTPINKIADVEINSYKKTKMTGFEPAINIVVPYSKLDDGDLIKFYEGVSDLFLENNLAVHLYILICKDEMFEDYVSKKGKIYPNDYYDEEIAKKYFVKTDKIDTFHYEVEIHICSISGSGVLKKYF